ncbi:MAG TPA: methyltransferase domain-containing protein [Ktedonobacteraceae bacterium]|nr:methyltransferase domain-containing protein [Ktedonobacteraceae bacterium]
MPAQQSRRKSSGFSTEVLSPESAAFQELCLLQAERFARAGAPGHASKYLETVDIDPRFTIPVAARDANGLIVGALILELPPATVIESVIRFRPGSPAAQTLARGTFGELRGFATRPTTSREDAIEIVDALGERMVEIAQTCGIEWLWLVPRRPLMSSLFFAEIEGVLPPCHFTRCMDVLGWNEASSRLQQMRSLRLKEIPLAPETMPAMYQITPARWGEDIIARLAAREQRRQMPGFPKLLQTAIRVAHQQLYAKDAQMNEEYKQEQSSMKFGGSGKTKSHPLEERASPPSSGESQPNVQGEPTSMPGPSFLPFAGAVDKIQYLRHVADLGGTEVQRYKTASFDLLQLEPGMEVLDVGCGIGLELLALTERVGSDGLVIGLDHDPEMLQAAQETCAGRPNVRTVLGEADVLPFPSRSFDAVRADRVLQYMAQPTHVLAEVWRVLKEGGNLTLVEPDWKMVALDPASPMGGNDDHVLHAVLAWNQRKIPQALVGRQLYSFLRQKQNAWENVQVQVMTCIFTSWTIADSMLLLTQSARQLAIEEPTLATDLDAWLQAMESASTRGEFLVSFPLFLVSAQKAFQKKE